MGIIDTLLSLFGGGSRGPEFGNLNPDDVRAYALASQALSAAERQGDAEYKAALEKYGLRSDEHWSNVRSAFMTRHRQNPDML